MTAYRRRGEGYASVIDKALRRAAQKAEWIAAATGTRLVVYEKGSIKRLAPQTNLESANILRKIRKEFPGRYPGYPQLKAEKLPPARKNLGDQQRKEKSAVVAEKRAKYGSRY